MMGALLNIDGAMFVWSWAFVNIDGAMFLFVA